MAPSFIRRKFNSMLGVATITMSVNYLVMLSGSIIVGNMVGPDGLAGTNVCAPAFGVAAFIASLLSVGSGLVFSQTMGAFDERRAAGVFSQSAVLAILCGLFIGVTMSLLGPAFFDFMGVTGEVRLQAESYWRWQALAMGLNPLVMLMEAMVMADGDGVIAATAGACHAAGSIGMSIVFTQFMGTAGGASAGTALAMVLVLAVTALHFRRRNNHLKFVRHWSRKDLLATVAGSLPDATIFLCWAVLVTVVNKLVVVNYGVGRLAVVALAVSVIEFSIIFDGVGEALIPIGGMYEGEGNGPALRKLANHSALMATVEGMVCGIVFYVFAPHLAPLFGISGEAANLLPDAIRTIRIMALAMPFMGFLMMANTHYLIVRHARFAVSVTVVKDFVLPCLFALLLGRTHFSGIWCGVVLGYAVAAAYPLVYVRLVYGRRAFPWLVKPDGGRILDFSIVLTRENVADARGMVERYLAEHQVPDVVVKRVMFAIEETGVASSQKNRGRGVIAEYAVFLDRPGFVRLVTRDTGRSFDVNGVTPYLTALAECRYLNTLNCNRSEYVFKL